MKIAKDATPTDVLWRNWLNRGILAVGALTCLYTAAVVWTGGGKQIILNSAYTDSLLLVAAFVCLNIIIRALRFYYYQYYLGWSVPLPTVFSAFVSSLCFSATPGKLGELVKVALLRTLHPISASQGVGIHVIERLIDLIVIAAFAMAGLFIFTRLYAYVFSATLAVGVFALLILFPGIHHVFIARITRLAWFTRLTERLQLMSHTLQALLRPVPLLVGGILGLMAWSCEIGAFYILIKILDIDASLLTLIGIYGIAVLAGALSMMPGGIGGMEIVMGVLLLQIGADENATVAVALFRIATLWLSSVIGLAFLIGWARPVGKVKPSARS